MNEIKDLIGNFGFPIAACCFMFYQNSKLAANLQEISRTLLEVQKTLEELRREIRDGQK